MKKVRYFLGRLKKRIIEGRRKLFIKKVMNELPNQSLKRLRELRGSYAGAECVIVGNGPSLNQTDLSKLKGLIAFFNGAFDLRGLTDSDNFMFAKIAH